DERQRAGREEAQQAGEKREREGGCHPQKQTADTTVVQRPSSPHSAVDVMFMVRTISPDRSHCSRRSSHALSLSNGTPSTVATIDAATKRLGSLVDDSAITANTTCPGFMSESPSSRSTSSQ